MLTRRIIVDGSRLLIRAAVPDDLDPVASIHTAARSAYYRGFVPDEVLADPVAAARRRLILSERMHDSRCTVLCAEADDHVIGFALLGPPHDQPAATRTVGQLRQIHVSPSHWRQGIGGALHQACIQAWQSASIITGQVDVWENNHRARAFYAHLGWQPSSRRRPGPADYDYLQLYLTIPR